MSEEEGKGLSHDVPVLIPILGMLGDMVNLGRKITFVDQ